LLGEPRLLLALRFFLAQPLALRLGLALPLGGLQLLP